MFGNSYKKHALGDALYAYNSKASASLRSRITLRYRQIEVSKLIKITSNKPTMDGENDTTCKNKGKGKATAQEVGEDPVILEEDRLFEMELQRMREEDSMQLAMAESRLQTYYHHKQGEPSGALLTYVPLSTNTKNVPETFSETFEDQLAIDLPVEQVRVLPAPRTKKRKENREQLEDQALQSSRGRKRARVEEKRVKKLRCVFH